MAAQFGDFLSGIVDGFQGLTMMSQGASLAKEGTAYAANQYRVAGSLGITGAQYKADSLRRAGEIAMQGAWYEGQVIDTAKKINTQGAEYQSASLVNAGTAAISAARYNKSLDEIDTDKTLNVVGRQIRSAFSSNSAIMSRTGLSSSSKSYLSVMNDALSTYEDQIRGIRGSALLKQQQIIRDGTLTADEYLNSANAAIYSSKVANYNLDNEKAAADYKARIAAYGYNNQATAAEFEGQVDNWRYEGQARQTEYEGKIGEYQAKVSQAQAIGGAIGKLGSLF